MLTIIKSTTKKGAAMLNSAKTFEGYTLNEVYSSYSNAKLCAYHHCLNKAANENGHNFHICAHNTFGFSVAWETEKGVRIETPKNSYLIVVC